MPGESPNPLQTPLFARHQALGGRIVEFGGWSMPVQYSSIVEEHRTVRRDVGLFDISHMGRLTLHGPAAADWIDRVTTNRVGALEDGRIQYSLMPVESGGILDDVLVYKHPAPMGYFVVCNASNRARVVEQFHRRRPKDEAHFADRTLDSAMLAVQGPLALETLRTLVSADLGTVPYYGSVMTQVLGHPAVVSRTGYTGEDGFELIVGAPLAETIWDAILDAGVPYGIRPCGLGARDTLRFEAGMPLYGHELDETIDPFESGLGWAVKLGKGDFVGRDALVRRKAERKRTRVGLALEGKRIARQGATVQRDGSPVGAVTSGTFSPTLDRSLAMALVPNELSSVGSKLDVDIRGTVVPAEVVPLPFYRRPKA